MAFQDHKTLQLENQIMFERELMFLREKSGSLRTPSLPSSFLISFFKELHSAMHLLIESEVY